MPLRSLVGRLRRLASAASGRRGAAHGSETIAALDRRLAADSREFLQSLTFDEHLMPKINGHVAGIDGVYHLRLS